MDWSQLSDVLFAPFLLLFDPAERLSLYYQLTALLFAVGVYVFSRAQTGNLHPVGLVRWLLPRENLTHPSAVTDYGFFVASKILSAAIYGSILISSAFWHETVLDLMTSVFGPPGPGVEPSMRIALACTLLVVLVLDATLWWVHYLFHVVPVLWQFHKVHHSAEVMTPITAARMHPVEEVFDSLVSGFTTGVTIGLLKYFLGLGAQLIQIFELNLFFFLFLVVAFNLRHSHVWLRYPAWLEHVFISPAQHQVHHSVAREHWDRNMGFIFAVWDWAAGTLCVTHRDQTLTFGLGTREDGTWHGIGTLFFRPFIECAAMLRQQPRRQAEPPAGSAPSKRVAASD